MSLPVISGRGFLISDGIELKFGKSGLAYARLPLSFKNSRKSPDGSWTHDKEVLIEGTVFGQLAESLAQVVTSRQELAFTGEVYVEEYEGKRYVKANVLSAWPVKDPGGAPLAAAGARSSGGADLPF
jgi:single-stranded DNA-binding protein